MRNVAYQIHELLNNMSPTEKSYVKKTFSSNQKNMVLLFDDLNKCNDFVKKTFLAQYQKRPYMKYLSQNCSYLLKNITKSLIDYNIENLTEINVMSRISSISLLVKKGLYSTCLQKIDKEIDLAEKFQYYEYGYKLIKLKQRFYKVYLLKELDYEEHIILDTKKKFFLKKLQLIDELELLTTVISNPKTPAAQKVVLAKLKLIELNLHNKEHLCEQTPLLIKASFNYIKHKINELEGKHSLKYLKQSLIDFDKASFLKGIYFESYILCISSYLEGLLFEGAFDKFFEQYKILTQELRSYPKWETMQTSPFYYIIKYFIFIKASVLSKQFNDAVQKSKKYQQVICKYADKLNRNFIAQAIELNATVFFNTGNIKQALDAIEELKSHESIETQYFYKTMEILCHYKLNNIMLIYSLSNSLTTFLRKNEKKEMLVDFLKVKKCLFDSDCNKLKSLEFLPNIDLNTLKNNNC